MPTVSGCPTCGGIVWDTDGCGPCEARQRRIDDVVAIVTAWSPPEPEDPFSKFDRQAIRAFAERYVAAEETPHGAD